MMQSDRASSPSACISTSQSSCQCMACACTSAQIVIWHRHQYEQRHSIIARSGNRGCSSVDASEPVLCPCGSKFQGALVGLAVSGGWLWAGIMRLRELHRLQRQRQQQLWCKSQEIHSSLSKPDGSVPAGQVCSLQLSSSLWFCIPAEAASGLVQSQYPALPQHSAIMLKADGKVTPSFTLDLVCLGIEPC